MYESEWGRCILKRTSQAFNQTDSETTKWLCETETQPCNCNQDCWSALCLDWRQLGRIKSPNQGKIPLKKTNKLAVILSLSYFKSVHDFSLLVCVCTLVVIGCPACYAKWRSAFLNMLNKSTKLWLQSVTVLGNDSVTTESFICTLTAPFCLKHLHLHIDWTCVTVATGIASFSRSATSPIRTSKDDFVCFFSHSTLSQIRFRVKWASFFHPSKRCWCSLSTGPDQLAALCQFGVVLSARSNSLLLF